MRIKEIDAYLDWFEPAWCALSEEKRLILKEFYMMGNLKSGAGVRLQFKVNYSDRQIYRIKESALSELSISLFSY